MILYIQYIKKQTLYSQSFKFLLKSIKLEETSERHTLNDEYENSVIVHIKAAAAECLPTKPRTKGTVPWESIAVRKKMGLSEKGNLT